MDVAHKRYRSATTFKSTYNKGVQGSQETSVTTPQDSTDSFHAVMADSLRCSVNLATYGSPSFGIEELDPLEFLRTYSVRSNYLEEVASIGGRVENLDGAETKAVEAHRLRREIATKYKLLTPEPQREEIYARNERKYRDPLGPSFESLVEKNAAKGKSGDEIFECILESSQRTNPVINRLYNLA